ncbi:type VI secretion system tube protein TssD [Zobellia laminariae]|uniref:type VI secretion system tube protein TssD n=1 Tax=Zobellia laminariae TaxID=248906 RepID=UPI003EF3A15C
MSFLAKLTVDGQIYNVLHCQYHFEQPMDNTGKPAGKPLGGRIMVTVESQGKYDLFHWMKEPEQTKDGSIVFFKRDAMSKLQEVKFSKAYCVSLEEEFSAISDTPMTKQIIISAKTITIGDMNFENSWGE